MNSQLRNVLSPFCLTTAGRRSTLVAVTCFLLVGAILPGRINYQKLEVLDSNGSVQQVFHLQTTDPRLTVLTDSIKATQQAQASKPDDYYISRWEMELSAIYAKDNRHTKPQESSERIAQASYIVQPRSAPNASFVGLSNNPASSDWTDYWKNLQAESTSRVLQFQQPAESTPIQARTRLAEVVPGARRTLWFVVQISFAVAAFMLILRLQTHQTSMFAFQNAGPVFASKKTIKRLPLHCNQQLSLPADMYVVRRSIAAMLTGQGLWLPAEIAMVAFIAANTASL